MRCQQKMCTILCTIFLMQFSVSFGLRFPEAFPDTFKLKEESISHEQQYARTTVNMMQNARFVIKEGNTTQKGTHVCLVVMGDTAVDHLHALAKSLVHNQGKQPYILHYVTNKENEETASHTLKKVGFKNFEGKTVDPKPVKDMLAKMGVEWTHHSGAGGEMKVALHNSFADVDKCIIIDTDFIVLKPMHQIFAQIDQFKSKEVLAANWRGEMDWSDRVQAGIMPSDFAKMRSLNWNDAQMRAVATALKARNRTGDKITPKHPGQEVLHATLMNLYNETDPLVRPSALALLDKQWNLEMCWEFGGLCPEKTYPNHNDQYEGTVFAKQYVERGALHFNCRGGGYQPWWSGETYTTWFDKCLSKKVNIHQYLPAKE